MKCPKWDDLLQQRLDGSLSADLSALDAHLTGCPDCRQWHAAAQLFEEGLRALPPLRPRAGLTDRIVAEVVADQRLRWHWRRRLLTVAAAACLMLAPVAAAYLALGPSPESSPAHRMATVPLVKVEPRPPVETPSLRQSVEQASSAVASLTDRIADSTREQARFLWTATGTVEVPMSSLPTVGELEPSLDLGAPSLREAGQGVSAGLQTVTGSARRAVDYFFRELPTFDSGPKSLQ